MGRKKKEETNDEAQERMDAEAAAVQEGSEETEETEEAEEEAEEEVEEEAEEETEEASEEAEEPARLEVTDENGALFNGDTSIRWKFDPEALVILGLDDHCDDDDPLADENAKSKLDDAQIKSVARDGVIQDVLICARNISGVLRPVLIDGRHRTRWARAANQRGLAKNHVFVHARCVSQKVPDVAMRVGKHTLNYVRAGRDILSQARAARELYDAGRKTSEIAVDMGISVSTVENFIALAVASKPLIEAIKKNALPVTAGYKLAKLPEEKQAEAVKEVLAEAKTAKAKPKVADAAKAKAKAKGNADAAKRPGISKVRKLLDAANEDEDVRSALASCEPVDFIRWLLGDVTERVLPQAVRLIVKDKPKKAAANKE